MNIVFVFLLLTTRGDSITHSIKQVFKFPDGSIYHGEVHQGRLCGEGEWRSALGERFVGSFHNDVYNGEGKYWDGNGNCFEGQFKDGAMDGSGTYFYEDGRADVGLYRGGVDVGEGVRLSPCRTRAWRLQDGKVLGTSETAEISLEEATKIASSLKRIVPESIYAVNDDNLQRMYSSLKLCDQSTTHSVEEYLDASTLLGLGLGLGLGSGRGRGSLIAHSSVAVVDHDICDGIVAECEARAAALGGWTTKRHENYPTTDVPLQLLPKSMDWFRSHLLPDIALPFLARAFNYTMALDVAEAASCLRVVDAFVVKYNASAGQRELRPHRDGSVFSFNIALNDLTEYEGGGTFFRLLSKPHDASISQSSSTIRSQKGHILAHSSALVHGGHPITSGVRYLLVCFVSVKPSLVSLAAQFYEKIRDLDLAEI